MAEHMDRRAALGRLGVMLGGAVSLPLASAVLQGCRVADPSGYVFTWLSKSEVALVSALVDIILPPTDTPGAVAAGVVPFVDTMMARWYDDPDVAAFRGQLDAFSSTVRQATGDAFDALSTETQTEFVADWERRALADRSQDVFQHGWRRLKELTLVGYYTSEVGATAEHLHKVAPGPYEGCIPVTRSLV